MRARGFTLPELMVTMVIGLLLLGGVMQVFVSNRASHRYQQNLSELQDNARFGLDFVARTVRMAGYRGDSPSEWVLGSLTAAGGTPAVQGTDNDAVAGNGILDGSDTITVTYEGSSDGFTRDCLGNVVPAGTTVSNRFAVTDGNDLSCSIDGGTTWTALIEDVEDMQIQYGLDTDGNQTANSYVTAANVTDTDNVVSVRVALLLRSSEANLNAGSDGNAYQLLDKVVYAAGSAPPDGRIRRAVMTTVKLRNRL